MLEFVIDPGHPCLPGHFPGRPIMPGVLIVEAMAQTGGVLLANRSNRRLVSVSSSPIGSLRVSGSAVNSPCACRPACFMPSKNLSIMASSRSHIGLV